MDNQDKIFNKFKEAAQNAEQKDFPGMDKVWARVEEKFDKKEDKKAIALWKKLAIAASLLLLISLGAQFLRSDKTVIIPAPKVVLNETEKDNIQNQIKEKENTTVATDSEILPKAEATKILNKQIKEQEQVALNEIQVSVNSPAIVAEKSAPVSYESTSNAPATVGYLAAEEDNSSKDKETQNEGSLRKAERESAKVAFADKQVQKAKKSAPLIVLNGNAMSHSNDEKRDKMMQAELPNLQPENVDSLVVLDAPLYIIDGIYYSENDLFGTNPTSPYAPLNKQEIKTITVLQDLEATSKYGEKGKKGVVIITTKYGKPAAKN